MNIHYFQHVQCEGLGTIADWVRDRGHRVSVTRFHEHGILPDLAELDWLIVMGGPMNVYEEGDYPWLRAEKRFIGDAIHAGKVVLGICLGAQLIADVLGARVTRNGHREIGWWPVELTEAGRQSGLFGFLPARFTAFHWHGDTFALPAGAKHIATSEGCAQQAFTYGERVVGLQFHLEVTPRMVRDFVAAGQGELTPERYVQPADAMLAEIEMYEYAAKALYGILDRLTAVRA